MFEQISVQFDPLYYILRYKGLHSSVTTKAFCE